MARTNKNILKSDPNIIGPDIRENLYKEIERNGTPFPTTPLTYEDIDKCFEKWVEEDLEIVHEGKKLETMVMYSNQRFSEFIQNWSHADNKKNVFLHFKTITREKNPKGGTIVDSAFNIPGNRWCTMKRVKTADKAGRPFYLSYKIKQPYAIDLNYKVSIVTNKIEVINEFNNLINEKFKSKQCYIRPNGHFIPMEIVSINDESENDLKGRQYMIQSYQIKVLGYIINQDDMAIFEEPVNKIIDMSVEDGATVMHNSEIEEYSDNSVKITTIISGDISRVNIIPDVSININQVLVEGIISLLLFVNGEIMKCEVYNGVLYSSIEYDKYGSPINLVPVTFKINNGEKIVYKAVKTCKHKAAPKITLIGNKL